MNMTGKDWKAFNNATDCHICSEPLGCDRVRDHCHVTGEFRGAAHNDCNLNYKFRPRIPVIFHNLRNYDSHLIMQGLGKLKGKPITAIPNNMEKYISFSRGSLVFLDSYQFMAASLSQLVDNVARTGEDQFLILSRHFPSHHVPLLTRKGVYPYSYMSDVQKFDGKLNSHRNLPSIMICVKKRSRRQTMSTRKMSGQPLESKLLEHTATSMSRQMSFSWQMCLRDSDHCVCGCTSWTPVTITLLLVSPGMPVSR